MFSGGGGEDKQPKSISGSLSGAVPDIKSNVSSVSG